MEKQWGGRGEALYRGWGGKKKGTSVTTLATTWLQQRVCGARSSIGAFIVSKVYVFIFNQYLPDLEERAITLWQSTLSCSLLTSIIKCKKS